MISDIIEECTVSKFTVEVEANKEVSTFLRNTSEVLHGLQGVIARNTELVTVAAARASNPAFISVVSTEGLISLMH
jgi:hypothetical protein